MTKLFTLILTLPLVSQAWIAHPTLNSRGSSSTRRNVAEHENPCWQNIYDEDCSMDNAYAASFVASEWIKSMPCADGIADCDMPDDLTRPGNRHTAEEVDVMDFLNIKRAKGVSSNARDVSP